MSDNVKMEKEIADFYDVLAPDFDAMTGFEKRFIAERPFFRMIVERFGIKSAVDAGCGTGFHALALAQLGVDVTAADVSPAMLTAVADHARTLDLNVRTVESDFQMLAQKLPKQYDAVFCLGNSLAHLLSDNDMSASLKSFAVLLKPEGILFVQLLNYEKVLAQQQRVQNVKEIGDTTFVRFYDFEDELVRFNILKLERKKSGVEHHLNSILLRPWQKAELTSSLETSGFTAVSHFGAISLEAFDAATSKDLVILARKS